MSLVLFETGAFQVVVKYLHLKGNTYYYRRRIPHDVRRLHPGKRDMLMLSLKTGDKAQAARKCHSLALQHDALWAAHREGGAVHAPDVQNAAMAMLQTYGLKPGQAEEYRKADLEPDRFLFELSALSDGLGDGSDGINAERLPDHARLAANLFYGTETPKRFLSDAVTLFQHIKAEDPESKAYASRQRAVREFTAHAGDLPLDAYRRDQVRTFIMSLIESGLKTDTVRRYLNYISPIFSVGIREYELNIANVFDKQEIPKLGADATKRQVYTDAEIRTLQGDCLKQDDDIAWLDAILSDSGMRLAEAVGLRREDIGTEDDVTFAWVRPNEVRPVKTKGSVRKIPLVGASLWGVKRALKSTDTLYLFPRYASAEYFKSTVASNTLTKRHKALGIPKGAHSWRHSMRDRLRNVGASEEVADRIGGWALKGVGQSYGRGHSLAVLHDWLEKTVDDETDKLIREWGSKNA